MHEMLLILNQPIVLWSLLAASLTLVLLDYMYPVDWLAYVGYAAFGVFIGATIATTPAYSLLSMVAVFAMLLILHRCCFTKFLTNAPRCQQPHGPDGAAD